MRLYFTDVYSSPHKSKNLLSADKDAKMKYLYKIYKKILPVGM